jgi:hypothetical protein
MSLLSARLGRALFARLGRGGERFFQARPGGWVFLLCFVLEMCLVPAADVLAPVWFMVKTVLQYRCPRRRPRVCFIPAP